MVHSLTRNIYISTSSCGHHSHWGLYTNEDNDSDEQALSDSDDDIGKFDARSDEGMFLGYSLKRKSLYMI